MLHESFARRQLRKPRNVNGGTFVLFRFLTLTMTARPQAFTLGNNLEWPKHTYVTYSSSGNVLTCTLGNDVIPISTTHRNKKCEFLGNIPEAHSGRDNSRLMKNELLGNIPESREGGDGKR